MTDLECVKLLMDAPEAALQALMDQYMGLVYTIVNNLLKGVLAKEDVEECTSDVFLQFFRQRDRVDLEKGSIKAYLCTIAKRKAINRYREATRKPNLLPLMEHLELTEGETPEASAMVREETLALIQAIHSLGQPDAEILLRKYYLGESSKAIAERLGMTVSNLDTRAHRAIKKLQPLKECVTYGG